MSQFNEDFIKSYNDDINEGYFLEIDVQYPENLHNLHNCLRFLSGRMNIWNVESLVGNLHLKREYFIPITNLNQALNHGLTLQKVIESFNLIKKLG